MGTDYTSKLLHKCLYLCTCTAKLNLVSISSILILRFVKAIVFVFHLDCRYEEVDMVSGSSFQLLAYCCNK